MAVLEIVTYPDERLKKPAEPVEVVDDEIRKIVDDMAETMYAAPGVGLAGNQVGVLKRIAVIDVDYPDGKPNLIVLINPEIVEKEGTLMWEEGCLSLPGINEEVQRHARVKVRALDINGSPFEIESTGDVLAVALQHETDHLDGVVFIDRLSFLKKRMCHKQLVKDKEARGR